MIEVKKMRFASTILIVTTTFCCVAAFAFACLRTESMVQDPIFFNRKDLPKGSFVSADPHAYASLGVQVMHLVTAPPRLHLPDLKHFLVYSGKNGRPDAVFMPVELKFTTQGGKALCSTLENTPVYLHYDKTASPCKYTFSPNNQETLIWFVARSEGNSAKLQVFMKDQEGNIIEDGKLGCFSLPEKEMARPSDGSGFFLGPHRVDATFLARQKARWVGVDLFLQLHGGEEFSQIAGNHRIDFNREDAPYSVFVKSNDCLIWDGDTEKWVAEVPGEKTLDKPLLHVKKIEDRVMSLELWEVGGRGKTVMNLVRTPEHFVVDNLLRNFHFLGARTKTQVVFQVEDTRMIVKPHDWLLLAETGWKKIDTAEDLDAYVERRSPGFLFIFEEVVKKGDKPVLVGTLFNASRTEMQSVEIALSTPLSTPERGDPNKSEPSTETSFANH